MAKKSKTKTSAPETSLRPRARPTSAPETSLRPKARPERARSFNDQTDDGVGSYAKGGVVRGAGAATRGKKFTRAG
jgi:hypothetical protein